MNVYLLLKWVHVLAAIVAVGSNLTYFAWLRLGGRSQSNTNFALRGIKYLDDRLANPSYVVLVVTGVAMMLVNRLPLMTPWIFVPIILVVVTMVVAMITFSPALQRQMKLADSPQYDSKEYRSIARRVIVSGTVISVLVVAITFFMVVKPALWG